MAFGSAPYSDPNDRLLEALDQAMTVRIIADDSLPRVAPRHDRIDGALKFDPEPPWHVQTLQEPDSDCQVEKQETKSVTAKPTENKLDAANWHRLPSGTPSLASPEALPLPRVDTAAPS
jgi:hypothetical protein